MVSYNYKEGKKRLDEILNNDLETYKKEKLPISEDEFTFTNGYFTYVSAVFVDMRNSTKLCESIKKKETAKILRSFISETIEILRNSDNLREIGVRGDCVYAIYTTPRGDDVYEIADLCIWVNTYIKMLNKFFERKGLNKIKVGIGMDTDMELVVKAGRKNTGINSKIWIGKAVTHACHNASIGNKKGYKPMIFSARCYENFIDKLALVNNYVNVRKWFKSMLGLDGENVLTANLVKKEFNKWIEKL